MTLLQRYFILAVLLLTGLANAVYAQPRRNGKFSIETEKGGVEKGRIKHGMREGTWKTYDAKGKLIQEESFLHGKLEGDYWRTTDSVSTTGHYTAGRKNGVFITKIRGKIMSEIHYQMDTLHGKYFIDTREKTVIGFYEHGKKSGLRYVDSLDYQHNWIKDSTYYTKGLKDGLSVMYVNSILVSRAYWSQGKRNGSYETFDAKTGSRLLQGNYLANERDGIWYTYENGKLRRMEDYENGIHASASLWYGADTTIITERDTYYPDGSDKLKEFNDNSGRLQQRWYFGPQGNADSIVTYYPSGKVKNGHYTAYVNDDGYTQFYLYLSFYQNGKLESRGFENKNLRSGTWFTYDSTGKMMVSMHYADNVPFGWFKVYYPNGVLKLQAYCYNGYTDTILVYSKAGVKVSQKDPAYSRTIDEVQAKYPDIKFRDPNKFPPDHHRKGIVSLGDPVREGKWSDEPAMFPGGNDSLNSFIKRTIRYPEPERRLSLEGEVHIKFLIEKDGSFSDVQVIKEVKDAPGFTKETVRMLRSMPKWIPAKTNGKIVRVYYVLPVKFTLE